MVMFNSVRVPLLAAIVAATAALSSPVAAAAAPVGPFAQLCEAGKPAALVRVSGFKVRSGTVSVKLYASNSSFLEKGAYLRKVEVPVDAAGPVEVCVPVPNTGRYALAVRHEVKGSKSRSDGGGFSGNPKISFLDVVLKRKPSLSKVSFSVDGTTQVVPVTLQYLQGGSVRAVS
jgi:uncharacterized protein (DUF2141 family)